MATAKVSMKVVCLPYLVLTCQTGSYAAVHSETCEGQVCSTGLMGAGSAPIVAVPPDQRQAIEDAIMQAFLAGTDENFDKLLGVGFLCTARCEEVLLPPDARNHFP